MIKKVLIPSDPKQFKQELLRTKCAKRILLYRDGSAKIEMWNADKFKSASDLMGNIDSQLWHRKDTSEIIEAIYEIEDLDNLDANCLRGNEDLCPTDLYIHYKKGWSSFRLVDEHVVEYIIENDEITVFYNVGFGPGKTITKKISGKDMEELLRLMNEADVTNSFEKSDTSIRVEHGTIWSYDYDYNNCYSERNCSSLFTDESLNTRYGCLIDRITK